MSTLAKIEEAFATLTRHEQENLLKLLAIQMRASKQTNGASQHAWPVSPPAVSKTESKCVDRRIEEEFGKVEMESWK